MVAVIGSFLSLFPFPLVAGLGPFLFLCLLAVAIYQAPGAAFGGLHHQAP
jgi:hypothetical protein